jgi:nicotinate-nucleotide pyrophosphorylase (carboxylating)
LDTIETKELIRLALAEDLGPGDLTTRLTVRSSTMARARIRAKQDLIVSGLETVRLTMELVDPSVICTAETRDGQAMEPGATLVSLAGPAESILVGERTALNLLMRLSGTATLTGRYVDAVKDYPTRIVPTLRSTPGLRALEMEAVVHGGGFSHRFGLSDSILIRPAHAAAAGSLSAAVARAAQNAPHNFRIQVLITRPGHLEEALSAGAELVVLEGFSLEQTRAAVALTARRAKLEAGGHVTLAQAPEWAVCGLDYLAVSALTASAPSADVSLTFT